MKWGSGSQTNLTQTLCFPSTSLLLALGNDSTYGTVFCRLGFLFCWDRRVEHHHDNKGHALTCRQLTQWLYGNIYRRISVLLINKSPFVSLITSLANHRVDFCAISSSVENGHVLIGRREKSDKFVFRAPAAQMYILVPSFQLCSPA